MPANTIEELINNLKSNDDAVRGDSWLNAGHFGAEAVKPLAVVMSDADFEIARAARRALWKIVRYVGRPDAENERNAVVEKLNGLLAGEKSPAIRNEILWMLSEIGDDTSVKPMATLLSDEGCREDARMALQRIPGEKSLVALKTALTTASDNFKPNLAQSLRQRGVKVPNVPDPKLIPTKKNNLKPASKPTN